jgi:hypothetical protein
VIKGKRDKEVADILSISPRTIHNHLRSFLRKLNTETRTVAALEAFERLRGSSTSGAIGILTYISGAAIVLCSLPEERLCSVLRAMDGTERALARTNQEYLKAEPLTNPKFPL